MDDYYTVALIVHCEVVYVVVIGALWFYFAVLFTCGICHYICT